MAETDSCDTEVSGLGMPYIQRIHCTLVYLYSFFFACEGENEVLNYIKGELSSCHDKLCIHKLSVPIYMSISVERDKQNVDVEVGHTQLQHTPYNRDDVKQKKHV